MRFILYFFCLLIVSACSSDPEVSPLVSSYTIVDKEDPLQSYEPLSIASYDSGYLVLGTKGDRDGYILATDKQGNFLWDTDFLPIHVNPTNKWLKINDEHYFVCMDQADLGTYLYKVNTASRTVEQVQYWTDLKYPLAATAINNELYLLNYSRETLSSRVTKFSATLNQQWQQDYNIIADQEALILNHFLDGGNSYPFFIQEGGGNLMINTFFNFTLSTLLINPSNGDQSGQLTGFRTAAGVSAMVQKSTGEYAICRFNEDDVFLIPDASIATGQSVLLTELGGQQNYELTSDERIKMLECTYEGAPSIMIASTSRDQSLVFYFYDLSGQQLLGKRYLGEGYANSFADIQIFSDGSAVVLGKSFVFNEVPRITISTVTEHFFSVD